MRWDTHGMGYTGAAPGCEPQGLELVTPEACRWKHSTASVWGQLSCVRLLGTGPHRLLTCRFHPHQVSLHNNRQKGQGSVKETSQSTP